MILVLQNIKLKPDIDSQRDYMAVEFGLALGMYKLSIYDSATSHLLNVESVAKKEKDDGNICLTSYYLGEVEYSQNKFTSSAEYYEIAIMKYDTNGVGLVYNVTVPSLSALFCKRGTMMRYASKIMEAVKLYKKGVELAKSSRDLDDRLSAHTCLGNLYQSLGDYSKSVEEYKETIQLAEELKDYISLGWAHGNIGNGYLGLSKKSEALNHLEKALNYTLVHEPVPQAIGRAYNNLGTAYQSLSHLDRARDYYEQALFQAIYGNDRPGQARYDDNRLFNY
jgi:tetratricopeptide (TPR) repeat protein